MTVISWLESVIALWSATFSAIFEIEILRLLLVAAVLLLTVSVFAWLIRKGRTDLR